MAIIKSEKHNEYTIKRHKAGVYYVMFGSVKMHQTTSLANARDWVELQINGYVI